MRVGRLVTAIAVAGMGVAVVRMLPEPQRVALSMFGEFYSVDEDVGPFGRYRSIRTGAQTAGRYSQHEVMNVAACGNGNASGCGGDACAPPMHYHTKQEETFTVLSGQAMFVVEGKTQVLYAGSDAASVTVPMLARHTFCRGPDMTADETLVLDVNLAPALNADNFFRTFVGIFNNGRGSPSPVHLLWALCAHHVRLADIPPLVHEGLCVLTNFAAPLFGYSLYHREHFL